ncbi:hypothetical protein [Demequina aestuarii]|uniref:hypothetical protein n=1 Tax=Demequina aestuarii TaxID=327095 RepID=UPI0009FFB0AB|nr:hypothetical protein [Demequina aestuarii]
MNDELQLISDGDGLAVIGEPGAVERFLVAEGLQSRELALPKLANVLASSAGATEATSIVAASSGRWLKLTADSASKIDKYGLMKGSAPGLSRGVVTSNGKIKGVVEFAKGPGALLTNPAMLAGAAGVMAQLAMQQQMDAIADYLEVIDKKIDDVLRAQKDGVLADVIAVGLVIEEATTIRAHVGRISEVSWSKVQSTSLTIARTQAYALRQLDGLAENMESHASLGDLVKATGEAEAKVKEWLAVLAFCFQLQDAIAILELDRVLDAAPEELDQHRLGLNAARDNRVAVITRSTLQLLARIDAAAAGANSKVLLHPRAARQAVASSNQVSAAVVELHAVLGIGNERAVVDARRWREAASDARDRAIETGSDGLSAAKRFGSETLERTKSASGAAIETGTEGIGTVRRLSGQSLNRTKSVSGKLSGEITERARLRRWTSAENELEDDTEG